MLLRIKQLGDKRLLYKLITVITVIHHVMSAIFSDSKIMDRIRHEKEFSFCQNSRFFNTIQGSKFFRKVRFPAFEIRNSRKKVG